MTQENILSDTSAFKGKKLAIMVASGFNEEQFLIIQKTILAAEGSYTIVSRDIGTTTVSYTHLTLPTTPYV